MVMVNESLFGGLTAEEFMRRYWHKKPLLVRGALPDLKPPLSPEELAGLSLEDDVVSRLVQHRGSEGDWEVRYGPFEPEDFETLPEREWSLLVQEVDRWSLPAARVLEHFRFIPNWRIDDLMVSYAAPGGGVGAHVDNYDVFLIQVLGRREWQISDEPVQEEVLVPDVDLRVLADFSPDHTWELVPGDMLYLPPRYAHNGTALDACMTLSVGFRAPSHVDIVDGFMSYLVETIDPDARYADPHLLPQEDPGRVHLETVERLMETLLAHVDDPEAFRSWLGRHVTEPKRGAEVLAPEPSYDSHALRAALSSGAELVRLGLGHYVYLDHPDGNVSLFALGEEFRLDPDLAFAARIITGSNPLRESSLGRLLGDQHATRLLLKLVNDGLLAVEFPNG